MPGQKADERQCQQKKPEGTYPSGFHPPLNFLQIARILTPYPAISPGLLIQVYYPCHVSTLVPMRVPSTSQDYLS